MIDLDPMVGQGAGLSAGIGGALVVAYKLWQRFAADHVNNIKQRAEGDLVKVLSESVKSIQSDLNDQRKSHQEELESIRAHHTKEIERLKEHHTEERNKCTKQIDELREEVEKYGKLSKNIKMEALSMYELITTGRPAACNDQCMSELKEHIHAIADMDIDD